MYPLTNLIQEGWHDQGAAECPDVQAPELAQRTAEGGVRAVAIHH